jgi:hypothetical protein
MEELAWFTPFVGLELPCLAGSQDAYYTLPVHHFQQASEETEWDLPWISPKLI